MLEDLLNPVEEREIGKSKFCFPGSNGKITAKVIQEFQPGGDVEAENKGEESDGEHRMQPHHWEKAWSCVSIWRSCVLSTLRLVVWQHCFCNNNCPS